LDGHSWVADSEEKVIGVELGKGFDPIVEEGRDEREFLSVLVDDGEAEGGFEV
jgi:hypothetical protein